MYMIETQGAWSRWPRCYAMLLLTATAHLEANFVSTPKPGAGILFQRICDLVTHHRTLKPQRSRRDTWTTSGIKQQGSGIARLTRPGMMPTCIIAHDRLHGLVSCNLMVCLFVMIRVMMVMTIIILCRVASTTNHFLAKRFTDENAQNQVENQHAYAHRGRYQLFVVTSTIEDGRPSTVMPTCVYLRVRIPKRVDAIGLRKKKTHCKRTADAYCTKRRHHRMRYSTKRTRRVAQRACAVRWDPKTHLCRLRQEQAVTTAEGPPPLFLGTR